MRPTRLRPRRPWSRSISGARAATPSRGSCPVSLAAGLRSQRPLPGRQPLGFERLQGEAVDAGPGVDAAELEGKQAGKRLGRGQGARRADNDALAAPDRIEGGEDEALGADAVGGEPGGKLGHQPLAGAFDDGFRAGRFGQGEAGREAGLFAVRRDGLELPPQCRVDALQQEGGEAAGEHGPLGALDQGDEVADAAQAQGVEPFAQVRIQA